MFFYRNGIFLLSYRNYVARMWQFFGFFAKLLIDFYNVKYYDVVT